MIITKGSKAHPGSDAGGHQYILVAGTPKQSTVQCELHSVQSQ
jgi:hypothetical protein